MTAAYEGGGSFVKLCCSVRIAAKRAFGNAPQLRQGIPSLLLRQRQEHASVPEGLQGLQSAEADQGRKKRGGIVPAVRDEELDLVRACEVRWLEQVAKKVIAYLRYGLASHSLESHWS